VYSRFIPREELGGFAAWQPGSFGDDPALKPRAAPPVPDPETLRREAERAAQAAARRAAEAVAQAEADRLAAIEQARHGGYHDGYRDGLSALENFKQSFAAQTSAQVTAVVQRLQEQLEGVEQNLAQRVAGIALEIARQVVRSELSVHPERVVALTQEALGVLLVSARHAVLRVHPDDHALVAEGCGEALAARGVRLLADAQIEAGGCLLESDIGAVDARVATRWQRAAAALGREQAWNEANHEAPQDLPHDERQGSSA
jgi:flagellar assembly protein FliH